MGQRKTTIRTGTWAPSWGYSLQASASMAQNPTNQNRSTGTTYPNGLSSATRNGNDSTTNVSQAVAFSIKYPNNPNRTNKGTTYLSSNTSATLIAQQRRAVITETNAIAAKYPNRTTPPPPPPPPAPTLCFSYFVRNNNESPVTISWINCDGSSDSALIDPYSYTGEDFGISLARQNSIVAGDGVVITEGEEGSVNTFEITWSNTQGTICASTNTATVYGKQPYFPTTIYLDTKFTISATYTFVKYQGVRYANNSGNLYSPANCGF